MFHPGWMVRTGRLSLVPVSWSDLPELEALKADPAVFAQMLGGVRTPAQTAMELADDMVFWGRHEVGMWTVRRAGEAGLLGITGIHERPDGRGFGLRFAFTPASRGHGYAREAAGAALRYAHHEGELARVVAVTREENVDSRTVLGAIGMRPGEYFVRDGHAMIMFASEPTRLQPS